MRLANRATYPSELPAIGPVASHIREVNENYYSQERRRSDPFILDTDKAAEFFGLDNEQAESLNQKQKRALTFLMWKIDEDADEARTPAHIKIDYEDFEKEEFAEAEADHDEERKKRIEKDYKENPVTQDTAQTRADYEDRKFEKAAKEYIDLAGVVVSGNLMLINMLDSGYQAMVEEETRHAEEQEQYQGIGKEISP